MHILHRGLPHLPEKASLQRSRRDAEFRCQIVYGHIAIERVVKIADCRRHKRAGAHRGARASGYWYRLGDADAADRWMLKPTSHLRCKGCAVRIGQVLNHQFESRRSSGHGGHASVPDNEVFAYFDSGMTNLERRFVKPVDTAPSPIEQPSLCKAENSGADSPDFYAASLKFSQGCCCDARLRETLAYI